MKHILIILFFFLSVSVFSQNGKTSWNRLSIANYFQTLKADKFFLQPSQTMATSSPDTTVPYLYTYKDTIPLIYFKGKNYSLGNGNTNIGGGSVSQDTKDTTITWTGNRTYVDIPSGIDYNPVGDPDVQITAATSTEGDTGQGFSTAYTYSTQTIRIVYPFAPIGVFTYTIKFTKAGH